MILNKMERKFGKYAINNLSLYLIIGYIIGYVLYNFIPDMYELITFNPEAILHGQVWRIISWVLTIPDASNIVFIAITLFFYYSIGTDLERTWGAFRYNVYIFSGILFTIIGGFIVYFVLIMQNGGVTDTYVNAYAGQMIGYMVSTYYINMSIFLAFAMTYPEAKILLYFIIPIKIKWLGYLYGAFIIFEAVTSDWVTRMLIIASLLNFVLFFFGTRNTSISEIKRKRNYRKSVAEATRTKYTNVHHKCAVCGRTEEDDSSLVFRYCSKCTGGQEYCQEHLFTHEHK